MPNGRLLRDRRLGIGLCWLCSGILVVECLWAIIGPTSEFACFSWSGFLDSCLPLQVSSSSPKPQGPSFSVPPTSPLVLSGPSGHRFNRDELCYLPHFSCDTFQPKNSPRSRSYFISVIRGVGHVTQAEGVSVSCFLTFTHIYIHFFFLLTAACLGSHFLSCFLSRTDLWVYPLELGVQFSSLQCV